MVDVPVDEADDTTDACTTLAVCDDGMSEKLSKLKIKEFQINIFIDHLRLRKKVM